MIKQSTLIVEPTEVISDRQQVVQEHIARSQADNYAKPKMGMKASQTPDVTVRVTDCWSG